MRDSLKIAIAGATGYVGLELINILSKHPKVSILYLCATKSIGKKINTYDKRIKKKLPKISKINSIKWSKIDVIFTALPNGESQKIAKVLPGGVKLIDLAGDFRLKDFNEYKKWYGLNHSCKNLLKQSIYALSEFSRKKLKNYKIIACPGCYPTSIQIPLVPLIKNKMIKTNNIIIDSKSGYSGAGKKIKNKFKFKHLFNSVSAYGIGSHKHMPEIDQELSKVAKKNINVFFTPHLIPMFRGILSTIYIDLEANVTQSKVLKTLSNFYKTNNFIKVLKSDSLISTNDVINTNNCYISVCKTKYKNKIIILSAIDNLIKGGAGQAVQNLNLKFNFPSKTGL